MKPTLDDIKAIQNKNLEEHERVRLCLDNLVCPECGGKLKELEIRKGWFLNFTWYHIYECENNDYKKETPIRYK